MSILNTISKSIFDADDVRDNAEVTVCSENISRKDIISTGRQIACEYIGSHSGDKDFKSVLGSADYRTLADKHRDKKLMYCAAQTNKILGKAAPKSIEDVRTDASYPQDKIFMRVMAEIDREIITPVFYAVTESIGTGLMSWKPVPLGRTTELTIKSNDVLMFEDMSFGSGRSTTKNYLYGRNVTVTPKVKATNLTLKWYQDVVNGDVGDYYAAIMRGLQNKIYAMLMKNLKGALSDTRYILPALSAETYTTANWLTITDLVAAANGITVNDLVAIGKRSALSNLLPVDSTGGAITGMQYGLGERWFGIGYLAKAGGVDLMPITPVIVPGTQNSTLETIDTGDNIFIMPKAGNGYAPMYGVYASNSPLTLTADIKDTSDMTIDINVQAFFDIIPLFASRIGVIQSVYPTE